MVTYSLVRFEGLSGCGKWGRNIPPSSPSPTSMTLSPVALAMNVLLPAPTTPITRMYTCGSFSLSARLSDRLSDILVSLCLSRLKSKMERLDEQKEENGGPRCVSRSTIFIASFSRSEMACPVARTRHYLKGSTIRWIFTSLIMHVKASRYGIQIFKSSKISKGWHSALDTQCILVALSFTIDTRIILAPRDD